MINKIIILFITWAAICPAATYYVATDGNDDNDGSSWTLAFKTISNGVARAVAPDDDVLVSNGTYLLTEVITITNSITVHSTNSYSNTFIDGGGVVQCVIVSNVNAAFEGFTVTNGLAVGGGGVIVYAGLVTNCAIMNNSATNGGGISLWGTNATAASCSIVSNFARSQGGGVHLSGANLINCRVLFNQGYISAGGILVYGVSKSFPSGVDGGIISNCLIAGNISTNNASSTGGGIFINSKGVLITDSIISNNNTAGLAGGFFINEYNDPLLIKVPSTAWIVNSTITRNTATNYGGGLIAEGASSVLITNCTISYNTARTANGGGIMDGYYLATSKMSSMTVTHSRVVGNVGVSGGGVLLKTNSLLSHCVVASNYAATSGGGIYIENISCATVRNCVISSNRTATGGGLYIPGGATTTVSACTIVDNYASTRGGGITLSAGVGGNRIWNSIICSNRSTAAPDLDVPSALSNSFYFSCANVLTNYLQGNTTNLPVFLDYSAGNLRLARNSSCINAGTNESWMPNGSDLDNRARIRYGAADIGAYEHIFEAAIFRGW